MNEENVKNKTSICSFTPRERECRKAVGEGGLKGEHFSEFPSSVLRSPSPSKGKVRRAFTLIELLVVVLIIGLLSAIAVPQYQKAVMKAKMTRVDVMMQALLMGLDTYVLENGVPNSYTYVNPEQLNIGVKFNSYNAGDHSHYNEYGYWKLALSPSGSEIFFGGTGSMAGIFIYVQRKFPSQKLVLSQVPEKLTWRKIVCEWWASRYGADTIVNGANPSYPAKTWCAEVGVQ